MKKIKLMMPALAIASTAAAVTPFVTSCKNNVAEVGAIESQVVKNYKDVDYKPELKPAKKVEYKDQKSMADAYAKAVNENPKIFADDFIYSTYYLSEMFGSSGNMKSCTMKVSNAKITNNFIQYDKETEGAQTVCLVSFDYNIRVEVKSPLPLEATNDGIWELNYHYTNLPFTMYFEDDSYSHPFLASTIKSILNPADASSKAMILLFGSGCEINFDYTVKDLKDPELIYSQYNMKLTPFEILMMMFFFSSFENEERTDTDILYMMMFPIAVPVYTNYFYNAVQKDAK